MGLEELYQTVEVETAEPIETKVTGTIPEWIEGSLYRNGPAKFEFGDTKVNHWFDGSAMLHRFKISKGHVTYQNRFIETEVYKKNMKANRMVCSSYGTLAYPDPCKTMYEKFSSFFKAKPKSDNDNVNVFPIGERMYAASETKLITRIDPETLKSKGQVDLQKVVCVNGALAHPHHDKDATYNVGSTFHGHPNYAIIKITPASNDADDVTFCEKAEIVAEVPARWKLYPGYIHSFGISENYYVFIEQVYCLNIPKIATMGITKKPLSECLDYYPNYPNKFHINDRRTGKKVNPDTEYIADGFSTFHHINAYEENGQLVVDICMAPRPVYPAFKMEKLLGPDCTENLTKMLPDTATRFVLPLDLQNAEAGKNLVTVKNTKSTATLKEKGWPWSSRKVHITADILNDQTFEFPQINYAMNNGMTYRYVYGVGTKYTPTNSIIKLDVQTREMKTWSEKKVYCSEPVFVAAPDAKDEDDGVLLSVVLTTGADRSAYLLVLDAHNMKEVGRAEAHVKIGMDMHGTFISAKV